MDRLPDLAVGDIIRLKKPHPCGSTTWEVLRVGMDYNLRCLECGRLAQLTYAELAKSFKEQVKDK